MGLAKSSRAELFDDGLDSGDDDVVAEDDDDIDEAIYGDDDDESDDSDEPQATRQMSVFSKTDDGVDDLLDSFDAEDQAGAAKAAEKAPASNSGRAVLGHTPTLEADVLEFRVLLEGALRAAAKVEPGQCDPGRRRRRASSSLLRRVLGAAGRGGGRGRARAGHRRRRRVVGSLEQATGRSGRSGRPRPRRGEGRLASRGGPAQASMGLKATNLGPFEQARLAATQDEEARAEEDAPEETRRLAEPEFYDDAGLYKAWLRDYASRSGSRKGGSSVPMQQRSSGGGVSRGSKGRGLRFEAHGRAAKTSCMACARARRRRSTTAARGTLKCPST